MPRNKAKQICFQIVLALTLILGAKDALCSPGENHFEARGIEVDVASVVRLGSSEPAILQTNLSYSFAGRELVWLEGVGNIAAVGKLRYAVRNGRVIFRARRGGKVLARIALVQTGFHEMPPIGDPFPSCNNYGNRWLPDGAPRTLSKALPGGIAPLMNGFSYSTAPPGVLTMPCRVDDEGSIETQWTTISNTGAVATVQLSMMITYTPPSGPAEKTAVLKTYFTCRDAYQASSNWNYMLGDTSLQTCKTGLVKYRQLLNGILATQ